MIDAHVQRPPILTTPRLLLRELRLDDADAVAAGAGDRRVARYLIEVPSPYPVALARRWIAGRIEWWDARPRRHARDRAPRGSRRAARHREPPPLRARSARRARLLARPRRRGAAATRPRRSRRWSTSGFAQLGLARIYAQVLVGNGASMRVLEKLGMVNEGTKRQHVRKGTRLLDVVLYGLLRDEWSAR